jgi:hypothetical protein
MTKVGLSTDWRRWPQIKPFWCLSGHFKTSVAVKIGVNRHQSADSGFCGLRRVFLMTTEPRYPLSGNTWHSHSTFLLPLHSLLFAIDSPWGGGIMQQNLTFHVPRDRTSGPNLSNAGFVVFNCLFFALICRIAFDIQHLISANNFLSLEGYDSVITRLTAFFCFGMVVYGTKMFRKFLLLMITWVCLIASYCILHYFF